MAEALRNSFPNAKKFLVDSCVLRNDGTRLYAGDVVLFDDNEAGELIYHLSVDGDFVACITAWSRESLDASRLVATYRVRQVPGIVSVDRIKRAVIHKLDGDLATVLLPRWQV